ncbi:MAG: DUF6035 family protein [Pseudomonadota bacterium]
MHSDVPRKIRQVIDLDDMKIITSDELINFNVDEYDYVRHQGRERYSLNNPRYVCAQCFYPVYAPKSTKRLPFWQHHKGAPKTCPWWTGDPKSPDHVSALQFQGVQEGLQHIKLKTHVADVLNLDGNVSEVHLDRYYIGKDGKRRRPDVRALWKERSIVFEIQLATTQINTIIDRENFYKAQDMDLIWLVWNFSSDISLENMLQSVRDVYRRHNNNIFSLDAETIRLSQEKGVLVFRAFAYGLEGWESKLVCLDDLQWRKNGLPFALSVSKSWQGDFRKRWLAKTPNEGMHWRDQEAFLNELITRLSLTETHIELEDEDVPALINAALSLHAGVPVGSEQDNLSAFANTFLYSKRRHKYADTFVYFAEKFGRDGLLKRKSVKDKILEARKAEQIRKGSLPSNILRVLFEDWI